MERKKSINLDFKNIVMLLDTNDNNYVFKFWPYTYIQYIQLFNIFCQNLIDIGLHVNVYIFVAAGIFFIIMWYFLQRHVSKGGGLLWILINTKVILSYLWVLNKKVSDILYTIHWKSFILFIFPVNKNIYTYMLGRKSATAMCPVFDIWGILNPLIIIW